MRTFKLRPLFIVFLCFCLLLSLRTAPVRADAGKGWISLPDGWFWNMSAYLGVPIDISISEELFPEPVKIEIRCTGKGGMISEYLHLPVAEEESFVFRRRLYTETPVRIYWQNIDIAYHAIMAAGGEFDLESAHMQGEALIEILAYTTEGTIGYAVLETYLEAELWKARLLAQSLAEDSFLSLTSRERRQAVMEIFRSYEAAYQLFPEADVYYPQESGSGPSAEVILMRPDHRFPPDP